MPQIGPPNTNKGIDPFGDFIYEATAPGIYAQNGILGEPLGTTVPGTQTIAVRGVVVNGSICLRCEDNIIVYLPISIPAIPTEITCPNSHKPLSAFNIPAGMRLSAAVFSTVNAEDLFNSYSVVTPEKIDWNVIKAYLDSILNDIKNYILDCRLDVNCIFDRVWDRVVRNFCGSNCFRDCSYDCRWYDLGCHGRKLDCERLKAQCKLCAAALDWAKGIVKGYLSELIAAGSPAEAATNNQSGPGSGNPCRCGQQGN